MSEHRAESPRSLPERGAPRAREPDGVENVSLGHLYRLLIQSVTDYAIFVLDPDGHIASWNPGAERLKGYREHEIRGRHFSVFYPREDAAANKPQRLLDTARREGHVEDEGWRVRKDGTRFWANVVITALHDERGMLVGFAKITRDLTARRDAEQRERDLLRAEVARELSEREKAELAELNEKLRFQTEEYQAQTEEMQTLAAELEETNEHLALSSEQAHAAKRQAQEAERRAWYLVKAGEILSASLDYQKTLQQLANLLVPELGDWCGVTVMDAEGRPKQLAVAHEDPQKVQFAVELNRRYPPSADARTGVANVLRTGKPELYPDIPDAMLAETAVDAEHLRLLKSLGMKSAMVVPLMSQKKAVGAVTLVSDKSRRRYDQEDLTLVMELSRIAGLAIENARAHESELKARQAAEAANQAKMQFLGVMSHELRTPRERDRRVR